MSAAAGERSSPLTTRNAQRSRATAIERILNRSVPGIEHDRLSREMGEVEAGDQVGGTDGGTDPIDSAPESEQFQQTFRGNAGVAIAGQPRVAVPLRKPPSVRADDQRQMKMIRDPLAKA